MAGIREKRVPVFFMRLLSFQNFVIILSKKCNLPARNGAYQDEGLQYKMRGDDSPWTTAELLTYFYCGTKRQ